MKATILSKKVELIYNIKIIFKISFSSLICIIVISHTLDAEKDEFGGVGIECRWIIF